MHQAPPRRLRPTIALKHHYQTNHVLLSLQESDLTNQIAYFCGGSHLHELKRAARLTNLLIRSHYAEFIHEVGRNVYPLILFTDYEVDGPCGIGSTLTLYRADGSVTQVSPALGSNYELYKSCSHIFMGLGVEVGPYLVDGAGDEESVAENNGRERLDSGNELEEDASLIEDIAWRASLTQYLRQARIFRRALINAEEVEKAMKDMCKLAVGLSGAGADAKEKDRCPVEASRDNGPSLPSPELCDTMRAMLNSAIEFCESCLSTGVIDLRRWKELNCINFPRIKMCMKAATKAQADACVKQIVEWRKMLGPKEWRELHVVIPTVWAVDGENPRKTMMQQLMDEDRVDSHIICSEYPRDHGEARTLLGRIVGDRAIGRFVFGDETKDQKVKTMGLSSEVDVVMDDALPAIWDAVKDQGCPVRERRLSSNASPRRSVFRGNALPSADAEEENGVEHVRCGRLSFC